MYKFCQILCFILKKLSQFQIIPKHVNIFNFNFLYYKLYFSLNNIYIASHVVENIVKKTKGTKVKALFQGLHVTREVFVLVYNFKIFISSTPFNIVL
jgi:hypothetical protein